MSLHIGFYVRDGEISWSYPKVFKNWAVGLGGAIIGDRDLRDKHLLRDYDFVIVDDLYAVELAHSLDRETARRVLPYAQTLRGLNVLRPGRKGILYSTASFIPFTILSMTYRRRIGQFRAILANSYGTASILHQLYNAYPTYVVHPGVDDSVYRPTAEKRDRVLIFTSSPYLDERSDPLDMYAVGVMVKAARRLGFEVHTFGREIPHISGVEQHVRVSDKQLIDLYSSSLVTFAPQPVELFGLVPVESMLCGTPVISTYFHDAMIPGVNGFVFNSFTIGEDIQRLVELDPNTVRQSVSSYTISSSSKQLADVLRLISGGDLDGSEGNS
jgi:glycosyltransferase involved in cell wall biosynthesis